MKFKDYFSNKVGIDLGTANTLVFLEGEGIILNEPSVVSINDKSDQVVAIGTLAKDMLGKTPNHIRAIRPIVEGVISDFEITEEMLSYLLKKVEQKKHKIFGSLVVIGVPCCITNVERRAVRDATKNAGAREVYIVEEPMASAIGIGMPINDPLGSMIIDIGGGTTDVAVISLAGIVESKNIKIAGDKLNNDIINYLKNEVKILIGEKTAEEIKITLGNVYDKVSENEMLIRGRDMVSGLPKEIYITEEEVRHAILPSILSLIDSIKQLVEKVPPEVVGDILKRGIYLSGGGALLKGLKELIESELKTPVLVANEPLLSVVKGCGIILEDIKKYEHILIKNDDEFTISPLS